MGLLLGKECAVVKLSKTSIKKNWFALDSWFCSEHYFEMCAFYKNLDNVLPVNKAFQGTLHSQRIDYICLVLEEILSLTLLRSGFYSVSFHFTLGWNSRIETSHKDAAPVKVPCCLPGCCFAAWQKHQCSTSRKASKCNLYNSLNSNFSSQCCSKFCIW